MDISSATTNNADMVDVAFITVNYNTKALVEDLVHFLLHAKLPFTFSITIVDNNSSDGSLDTVCLNSEVQIIRNNTNLGYGVAANKGVRSTRSRYVCVLNTDVILNSETLTAIWRFMEENSPVSSSTPVVRYNDGRMQLFFFKFSLLFCYLETFAKIYVKLLKLLMTYRHTPIRIDGVTGAFLFLRRSCIYTDDLFDEDFFFYYEDTDLAFRWKKRGYVSYALPAYSIIHLGGQSSGKGRNNKLFYHGKYLFLTKHYGEWHTKVIKRIDFFKIVKKVFSYRLLSVIIPSRKIMQKLASYQEYLRELRMESQSEENNVS